jgi:hypothetical protein
MRNLHRSIDQLLLQIYVSTKSDPETKPRAPGVLGAAASPAAGADVGPAAAPKAGAAVRLGAGDCAQDDLRVVPE